MREKIERLREEIKGVMIGKEQVTDLVLTALLAGGHVLVEDMPGTGKTLMAKTLARAIDASFARIQFTPDLLPTDITGLHVYHQGSGEFVLKKGPVFSQVILADEINRATPRTQAALLECMEEHQVTLDGETLKLSEPFFVIATQNPIETAGTFVLPEAQLDRFYMKLSMGKLTEEEELAMLDRFETVNPFKDISAVVTAEDVISFKEEANKVFIHPVLKKYIVDLCRGSREYAKIVGGVSPRATLIFASCLKSYAYLQGRSYIVPEDVQLLAVPVLAHRLVLSAELKRNGGADNVIRQIIKQIEVPTEDWRG